MASGSPTETTDRLPETLRQTIGFGCLMAWTYVTFLSRLIHYSTRNDISHLNSTYTFACCGMICAYVACAVLWQRFMRPGANDAGAGRNRSGVSVMRRLEIGAAVVLAACTVVLALVEREFFRQPWCSIASFVAGAAVALLCLGWGRRFVRTVGASTSPRFAASFVCAALLFVVVLWLPDIAGVVVTCCLPLLSLVALRMADVPAKAGAELAHPARGTYPVFARALVSVLLLGLAESLVRALFLDVDPVSESNAYRWLFLAATALAATLFAVLDMHRTGPGSVRTMTRVVMLALAFLMLLSPIVSGLSLAADLPPLVCNCLFNLLVWAYLAKTAQSFRIAPYALFGFVFAASYTGCLAGTFLGSLLVSFTDLGYRGESLLALACACLVLVSFLFIADERTLTALLDADDERPQAPRRFRLRVETVARDHGLTAKETEVLMLAAKGRTTQRIREELGISTGTVNTHLMHIYKKLGVHDRQQMLDMVDGRM